MKCIISDGFARTKKVDWQQYEVLLKPFIGHDLDVPVVLRTWTFLLSTRVLDEVLSSNSNSPVQGTVAIQPEICYKYPPAKDRQLALYILTCQLKWRLRRTKRAAPPSSRCMRFKMLVGRAMEA